MISYAISDPLTLSKDIDSYFSYLKKSCDMFLYRDKNNPNYKEDAKKVLQKAIKYNLNNFYIHSDIDTACKLEVQGVHLTSSQFNEIKYAKSKGLFTIISTHSIDDIRKAEEEGADMVTLSPIFYSPNKNKPLGIEYLKEALDKTDIPIIALGGIVSKEKIEELKRIGVNGFASIRYFTPKLH